MNYFDPSGPVINFTASTSAPTAVQALSKDAVPTPQVMVANVSTNVGATIGWGVSTNAASAAATSTISPNQFYINPNQQMVIAASPDAFYTGVTTTNTAVIFVQPGVQA